MSNASIALSKVILNISTALNNQTQCAVSLISPDFWSYIPLVERFDMRYIFPLMFIIGVSGNVLNIIILTHERMRSKTNAVLTAMAAADTLFFMAQVPNKIRIHETMGSSFSYFVFWIFSMPYLMAFSNWFSAASLWFTVIVTVERFIAVRYPLKAKIFLRKSRIATAIVLTCGLTFLFNLYQFFGPYYPRKFDLCQPVLYRGQLMTYTYRFWMVESAWVGDYVSGSMIAGSFLIILIPMILIITLNVILIRSLLLTKRLKNQLMEGKSHQSHSTNEEQRVTRMVVLMICSFILFNLPSAAIYLIDWHYNFKVPHQIMPYFHSVFVKVSNILVGMGKTINFIIYLSASDRFRKYLMLLICRKIGRSRRLSSMFLFSTSSSELFKKYSRDQASGDHSRAREDDANRRRTASLQVDHSYKFSPFSKNGKEKCHPGASPISLQNEDSKSEMSRRELFAKSIKRGSLPSQINLNTSIMITKNPLGNVDEQNEEPPQPASTLKPLGDSKLGSRGRSHSIFINETVEVRYFSSEEDIGRDHTADHRRRSYSPSNFLDKFL